MPEVVNTVVGATPAPEAPSTPRSATIAQSEVADSGLLPELPSPETFTYVEPLYDTTSTFE